MASYIVDEETINKIVSFLYAKTAERDTSIVSLGLVKLGFDLRDPFHTKRLANAMFDLNVAAIKARYGEAEGEGFPLPSFTYVFTPATQIEVIKALECWKYQCTVGQVPGLALYEAMTEVHCLLCADFVKQTEEYEAAPWG